MLSFVLAAAAALQPAQSPSAPAASSQAAPTRETLQRMCSAAGALGYPFGAPGAPHSTRLENMLGLAVELGQEFEPFARAQITATPWSGRLAFVTYQIESSDAAAEAPELIEALAAAAEEAGWRRNAEMEDPANLSLETIPVSGERVFEVSEDGRVVASIATDLGGLTLTCGHKTLIRSLIDEGFGELPPGTPRPQPTALPAATNRSPGDCERPEVQQEMLTIAGGRPADAIGPLLHRASYAERLTQWKLWRLRASGRVSQERLGQIARTALQSASPGGDPLAGFALFPEMFGAIDRLTALAKDRDAAAACRASVELVDIFERMEEISGAQWRAIDAAIEAEARRHGISLD
jgi:hypothetical protein